MRLLLGILMALATSVAAIPTFFVPDSSASQDLTSLRARDGLVDTSKKAPYGADWLYHLPNDKPFMHEGHPHWNQYPGEEKWCFSDIHNDGRAGAACWGVEGHWFLTAIDAFCRAIDGNRFDVNEPITSYSMMWDYWPASKNSYGERGSIKLQVGFADRGPLNPPVPVYTMDYNFCKEDGFLPILNYCDNSGINHKRGGYSNYTIGHHGNDKLFWLLDPNPYVQHPYKNDQNMCTNERYYWLPNEANVQKLGYVFDKCRNNWNNDISPADHSINPNTCWDCVNLQDGCTRDEWNSIDKLKNHDLENTDGQTAVSLPKQGVNGFGDDMDDTGT